MTVRELLSALSAKLAEAGLDSSRLDAELLLVHVLGVQRAWLFSHADQQLDDTQVSGAQLLADRRAAGEPLAYLSGRREFWSLPVKVDARVLVPRPETECLIEAVLQLPIPEAAVFVDAGTGSGAIALALCSERPGWTGFATDLHPGALQVCSDNIACHGYGARLQALQAHWLDCIAAASLQLLVSNPPYIPACDPHLRDPALACEPRTALASGETGLDDLQLICAQAGHCLAAGGYVALEHGFDQQDAVVDLIRENALELVVRGSDYAGQPRFVIGRRPAAA